MKISFTKYCLTCCLLTALITSCCTKIPSIPQSNGASWDGNERNSGFIGFVTNQVAGTFGVITPSARDRYNELIKLYKNRFIPPLSKDHGLINNETNYLITLEGLENFITMNRWYKAGEK